MLKLQCTKCNYKFQKEKMPHRCPYCGNEGTLKKEVTAQDVLDEVVVEREAIDQSKKERE